MKKWLKFKGYMSFAIFENVQKNQMHLNNITLFESELLINQFFNHSSSIHLNSLFSTTHYNPTRLEPQATTHNHFLRNLQCPLQRAPSGWVKLHRLHLPTGQPVPKPEESISAPLRGLRFPVGQLVRESAQQCCNKPMISIAQETHRSHRYYVTKPLISRKVMRNWRRANRFRTMYRKKSGPSDETEKQQHLQ